MTSISGVSSSSSGSGASNLTAAKSALGKLLILNGMQASLDSGTPSQKPTAQKVLSTLWSIFSNDSKTLTKSAVQKAVTTTLGGTLSDANAIWKEISPYGLNNINQTSFDRNSFITSTINANMSFIQKAYSTYTSSAAGIAENSMSKLLTSNDVIQALASGSSTYAPPTTNQMLSTLWALFDVSGAKTISQSDVKNAVLAEGGTISGANAIWAQLAPKGASSINVSQFITSPFLTAVMTANNQTVQSDVSKVQLINTGMSNSILDKFSSGGADILNGAATGYNNSPIGGPGGYTNYLNLFL